MLLFYDDVQLAWLLDEAATDDGLVKLTEQSSVWPLEDLYLFYQAADLEVLLRDDLVLLLGLDPERADLLHEPDVVILFLVQFVLEVTVGVLFLLKMHLKLTTVCFQDLDRALVGRWRNLLGSVMS